MNNNFNILKLNGLIRVHMLIIEKMWKKPLIHSNINLRFWIITYVLINYDKFKMQHTNNGFNFVLKMDGSIHVPCW
jgi:hypothetical protein